MDIHELPIAMIDVGPRLRGVDPAYVTALAENIVSCGRLRNAIEVQELRNWDAAQDERASGGADHRRYALVAGAHRLAAVASLGWQTIPAQVVSFGSADEARLAEIDENLVRHDLNPLDRAVFLAEREDVYLRIHPETGRGKYDRSLNDNEKDITRTVRVMSFAQDTASRLGLDDSTVRRAMQIAKAIGPEIRARLTGTRLARSQKDLLALARLEPAQQHEVLDLVLGADGQSTLSVAEAVAGLYGAAGGKTKSQSAYDILLAAWNACRDTGARHQFLDHLDKVGAISSHLRRKAEAAAAAQNDDGDEEEETAVAEALEVAKRRSGRGGGGDAARPAQGRLTKALFGPEA